MLAFSNDYYGMIFRATQSVELFCAYLENALVEQNIVCDFTYFSDDFYFFCNKEDVSKIIQIFYSVLDQFDLQGNETNMKLWDYEKFNSYNVIARYWKN